MAYALLESKMLHISVNLVTLSSKMVQEPLKLLLVQELDLGKEF